MFLNCGVLDAISHLIQKTIIGLVIKSHSLQMFVLIVDYPNGRIKMEYPIILPANRLKKKHVPAEKHWSLTAFR